MRLTDVRFGAVQRVVAALGDEFATRDVSEHPDCVQAHGVFADESNYHSLIGKRLKESASFLEIEESQAHTPRGSQWRKRTALTTHPETGCTDASVSTGELVRAGHWRAVEAMRTRQFEMIVALFDADPRVGGAYFRVVDKGFQPVDLHSTSVRPLIAVGSAFTPATSAAQLAGELDLRVQALLQARATASPSVEKRLEARLIRGALRSGL